MSVLIIQLKHICHYYKQDSIPIKKLILIDKIEKLIDEYEGDQLTNE